MRQFSKLYWLTITLTSTCYATTQKWDKVYTDTASFAVHTATVAGKKYIGFLNDQTYFLLNVKGDTVIKKTDYYFDAQFKDFTKDGYKDIILHYSSNAPMVLDLFAYVPTMKRFKEIKDFRNFPAPEQIKGTKYYYSYHKSGCADSNWDSDLFYIDNLTAIRIGNISGRQCDNRDNIKDAIYIYKVHSEREKLFKTFPVDTIEKYKDYKWGFIRTYWTKNYTSFI